jgi:alkylhydroperoxidase family enzyme
MPRLTVPEGEGSIVDRVWELRPALQPAWEAMKKAANVLVELPVELLEVVRYRLAHLNGCLLCQAGRDARAGFGEDVYAAVLDWRSSSRFDSRQRLALEYTEAFATSHLDIGDEIFGRLRQEFAETEILDLTFYIGRYLAFGRLAHVLGLDDSCAVDGHAAATSGGD